MLERYLVINGEGNEPGVALKFLNNSISTSLSCHLFYDWAEHGYSADFDDVLLLDKRKRRGCNGLWNRSSKRYYTPNVSHELSPTWSTIHRR